MCCRLSDFGIEAEEGDIIEFIMPSFCTGNYIYKVSKRGKELILKDAPPKIFDGCMAYNIIKKP